MRYSRNIACIGAEGQKNLSSASVFIIGCGALGSQVAMLLAGAGVGRLGIADFDTIDLSNLQRQLFFRESECGHPKVFTLAEKIKGLNSEVTVDVYGQMIRPKDGSEILQQYDYIIDATDNPATKYMTDRICREIGKPGCIAGVSGWEGQIMCITGQKDECTAMFADVFPPPEENQSILPCEVNGVLGPVASTIASLQAAEAIKYFTKSGDPLINSVLTIDLKSMRFHRLDF